MSEEVVIEARFRGPPGSANGGYACGTVARSIESDGAVEVTLRAPPPLDTPLAVERVAGGAELRHGEHVIAAGRPVADLGLELPEPVSLEQAERARREAPVEDHPFPGCFVCGPDRLAGDGMRVVCGPVPGRARELVGSVIDTGDWLPGQDGAVSDEIVWAALDCPGGIAGTVVPVEGLYLLGRLTAELRRPLQTGSSYVAIGWPIGEEGRKFHGGSAILDSEGEPFAVARSTWIRVRETS